MDCEDPFLHRLFAKLVHSSYTNIPFTGEEHCTECQRSDPEFRERSIQVSSLLWKPLVALFLSCTLSKTLCRKQSAGFLSVLPFYDKVTG